MLTQEREARICAGLGLDRAAVPLTLATADAFSADLLDVVEKRVRLDGAGVSAWLAVPDCEGMSVLTAWAAGKLTAQKVAELVKESEDLPEMQRKRLVLPGYVAVLKGEIEDGLPGWDILVGPQESADIESFLKELAA